MTYTLQISLPGDITSEQRLGEINHISALFNDPYPQQRYRRDGLTGQIFYFLTVQFEMFPCSEEQIAYLATREFTLTGTLKGACAVCSPVTAPLIAVKEV